MKYPTKNRCIAATVICLLAMAASCNKDLGNYDYTEVNDVSVSIDNVYYVEKKDTVFTIRPTIHQTTARSNDNLRFVWTMNSFSDRQKGDTVSITETLEIPVKASGSNYVYSYFGRLYVTDTITRAVQMHPFRFFVKKPYLGAWMVLHEKDNHTQLGSIEFLETGHADVTLDAYFDNNKKRLTGKPVKLGKIKNTPNTGYWNYEAANTFYCITTNPKESGILMQSEELNLLLPFGKFIYEPEYVNYFDETKIESINGATSGSTIVSNGRVFAGSYNSPKMYEAVPHSSIGGGTPFITKGAFIGRSHVFYDEANHRFLTAYAGSLTYVGFNFNPTSDARVFLNKVPGNANFPGVNPENIGADKDVIHIGSGYWYGRTLMGGWARIEGYAVALSNTKDEAYVYEFHTFPLLQIRPEDPEFLTGYYSMPTPVGVTKDTPFASGIAYNKLMFYASGNKVYRFDYSSQANRVQVVWTHPNPSAEAKVMKMAFDGNPGNREYDNYLHDVTRSLGVVFDLPGNTSDVVILNLNMGGTIDTSEKTYPSVRQFEEFGKVTDIEFI